MPILIVCVAIGQAVSVFALIAEIRELQGKVRDLTPKSDAPSKACWLGDHGGCEEYSCACACHKQN